MRKTFFLALLLPFSIIGQWVQISTVSSPELRSIKFFNEQTGIIVGQGGIWRSTNSGINWTQVLNGSNMNSLSFASNSIGYSVGDSGKIYKTTNGGENWNQIGSGITTKKLNAVSFPAPNTGWIMGESGKILYTFNGGSSFANQTNGDTTYDINYLQMVNSSTGYFCGSSNFNAETFGYSPNGGINWLYSLFMNGNVLNSVCYVPTSNGNVVAVGTNGRIRKTTSNGTTWNIINSPINVQLNHIVFIDASTGYIAGNSGNILKTTNSGLNWTIDATVTPNNLKCFSFINSTTAWVVGSNGVVLRTGIPVSVQTHSGIVNYLKLEQNYPNPFNPSTLIKFSIPENCFVKLTVLNVVGSEIATLINKYLVKGDHIVRFENTGLSNGVYFYRLQSFGERIFVETKKMILIK